MERGKFQYAEAAQKQSEADAIQKGENTMIIFHAGELEIREPDLKHGRKNADFGQGFYTTPDEEFAARWARAGKGTEPCVNMYELDTEELRVKLFTRDEEWARYIYSNRRAQDTLPDYDVIIGPIANDTLYDVLGLTTSGMLTMDQTLAVLQIGPVYEQVVLKSDKAAANLRWISSRRLRKEETSLYKAIVKREEEEFQKAFAEKMRTLMGD